MKMPKYQSRVSPEVLETMEAGLRGMRHVAAKARRDEKLRIAALIGEIIDSRWNEKNPPTESDYKDFQALVDLQVGLVREAAAEIPADAMANCDD